MVNNLLRFLNIKQLEVDFDVDRHLFLMMLISKLFSINTNINLNLTKILLI